MARRWSRPRRWPPGVPARPRTGPADLLGQPAGDPLALGSSASRRCCSSSCSALGPVAGHYGEPMQRPALRGGPPRWPRTVTRPCAAVSPRPRPGRPGPPPASGPGSAGRLLGRVKPGAAFAEDLLAPPDLDPLGTLIPADHPPLEVEHEDGVVGDTADQQPQPLLAVPGPVPAVCVLASCTAATCPVPPSRPPRAISRQLAAVLPAQDDLQPRPDGRSAEPRCSRCWWAWR